LFDEPTAGLDPEGRAAFWQRLADARAAGTTHVVATHDLSDVAAHAGRVLVFGAGRLLADATPAALVAAHARARAVLVLAAPPGEAAGRLREALGRLDGAPEAAVDGRTVTLWRDRNPEGNDPAL